MYVILVLQGNRSCLNPKIRKVVLIMENTKKVIKRTRKVNVKDIAKVDIMNIIQEALEAHDIDFKDGVDYGMTNGTIIVTHDKADVQIKPISPKAGLERYQEVIFEEE